MLWNMKGEVDYVDEWFLMKSPLPLMIIMVSYWLFVLKLGPRYMIDKKPYTLNNTLAAYNAIQVVLSWVIFITSSDYVIRNGIFPSVCPQDTADSRAYFTKFIYLFLLAKITELFDTIFFVLRKKDNQVTFLHVYHHSISVILSWFALKTEPFITTLPFLGATNAFVHIFMYTYYGLSAVPTLHKYLWWKKYITKLQLIQFIILMVHMVTEFTYSKCKTSRVMMGTLVFHMLLFVYLFGKFYIKAYICNQKQDKTKSTYNKKIELEKFNCYVNDYKNA